MRVKNIISVENISKSKIHKIQQFQFCQIENPFLLSILGFVKRDDGENNIQNWRLNALTGCYINDIKVQARYFQLSPKNRHSINLYATNKEVINQIN